MAVFSVSLLFRVSVLFCLFFVFGCQYQYNRLSERLVSEMTCYVSSGTLNATHSLTHSLQENAFIDSCCLTCGHLEFVEFLLILLWYSLVGIVVKLCLFFSDSNCPEITKYTHIRNFPLLETSLFVLMSYATFLAAEAARLTGVHALISSTYCVSIFKSCILCTLCIV